jgi:1-phosphofructokinase family hexose kinase
MIYTVTLNPAVDREYVVPKLVSNTVLRASEVHIDYGGKGFNVSRMLTAMGVGNTALGFIGSNAGAFLEKGMASLGISTDFVHISHETRTNTTIVETNGQTHYKVNESGPAICDKERDLLKKKITERAKPGDWWVLAGSLPPGIPDDFYQELIVIIQSAGAKAILDTSGQALLCGVKAKPYLIKPNVFEASTLTGISGKSLEDLRAMLKNIHASGVSLIAISAGKDASIFSDGEKVWHANPPKIEEANPVGAGDAMLAGVLFGLYNGLENAESFAWGIAAGSAAAGKTGTGMPSKDEVENLKKRIDIKEIEHAL